jgi:hypothetical protein
MSRVCYKKFTLIKKTHVFFVFSLLINCGDEISETNRYSPQKKLQSTLKIKNNRRNLNCIDLEQKHEKKTERHKCHYITYIYIYFLPLLFFIIFHIVIINSTLKLNSNSLHQAHKPLFSSIFHRKCF